MTSDAIEALAERVHQAYIDTCERLGWAVKPENQVPYGELSDDSKELDRASVRAVLSHPEAVKVLLETGALKPAGVLDTESGLLHVCGPDDEPEPQDLPVYRLVPEETR